MNARRVTAFVESLRRNRRPKAFNADADDVEVMRAAIELNNAEPGAALPRAEFVSDLHRHLADQLNETGADEERSVTRLSRRRVIGAAPAARADHRGRLPASGDRWLRGLRRHVRSGRRSR